MSEVSPDPAVPASGWKPGDPRAGVDAIRLRDLTVTYQAGTPGAVRAIEGLSLSLRPGEFVSVIGPSGCGKTTILNVLAGFLPEQTCGEVGIFGKPPTAGNRDVAYMLARDSLLPWRTTLENAAYGMEIRGVTAAERKRRAMIFLKQVGLGDFADAYPKALSQGMRQRCALARTFALESDALLMDEPFGAIDAQTKLQLEELLLDLWSANQRTVIFVTHDLAEAVALSDRVIVISARPGRILADIKIELSRPRHVGALHGDPKFHELYARLWGLLEQGISAHAP